MNDKQTHKINTRSLCSSEGYLDKKVSLEKILIFTLLCLSGGISIYCYWVWSYWQGVSHGGVSIINSGYLTQIPPKCLDSIDVHRGSRTVNNSVIIPAPRTFLVPLEKLIAAPECVGYQLLSGMQGDQWASFRVIYTNEKGEKMVTRTVEYLKK
jgi:hypothetical protein